MVGEYLGREKGRVLLECPDLDKELAMVFVERAKYGLGESKSEAAFSTGM